MIGIMAHLYENYYNDCYIYVNGDATCTCYLKSDVGFLLQKHTARHDFHV